MDEKVLTGIKNCYKAMRDGRVDSTILCYKSENGEILDGVTDFKKFFEEELDALRKYKETNDDAWSAYHGYALEAMRDTIRIGKVCGYSELVDAIKEYEGILDDMDNIEPGFYIVTSNLTWREYFVKYEPVSIEMSDMYKAVFKDGKWDYEVCRDQLVLTRMFNTNLFILLVEEEAVFFCDEVPGNTDVERYAIYNKTSASLVEYSLHSITNFNKKCRDCTTAEHIVGATDIDGEMYYYNEAFREYHAQSPCYLFDKGILEWENKSDKWHTCKDCGKPFEFWGSDKEWFDKRGLAHPKRCRNCRDKRKRLKEDAEYREQFMRTRSQRDDTWE